MGNVYEALIGLWWLEGRMDDIVHLVLNLLDIDQLELSDWRQDSRRQATGHLRGQAAVSRTRYIFVRRGRDYGYRNGGPAPAFGAAAGPREDWLAPPGQPFCIPE